MNELILKNVLQHKNKKKADPSVSLFIVFTPLFF